MCTQTYTESPLERSFSPEKIRLVFMVMVCGVYGYSGCLTRQLVFKNLFTQVYQKYDEFCMSFMFDDQFLLTR
uniref:Uncharacterized protein n=1 Tax=Daphnia magna TaxID=35525 RepID=A0A0P6HQT5_9CRUS